MHGKGLVRPHENAGMLAAWKGKPGFLPHPLRLSRNAWLGTVPNHAFPQHRCTGFCRRYAPHLSHVKGCLCMMQLLNVRHGYSDAASKMFYPST